MTAGVPMGRSARVAGAIAEVKRRSGEGKGQFLRGEAGCGEGEPCA